MNRKIITHMFYALPASIIMLLIIGPILRGGMFIDGLLYTNIAKNLASGTGDFWHPIVNSNYVLYGHPPLLFWLESLFFHVFGDHLFTEDIYNFTITILTIGTMYGIWHEIVQKTHRKLFFLPLLLWALSQEVQLRYPNSMLECGMTTFLLITMYFYLKTVKSHPLLAAISTGFGAFIAILCKGPAGLFILSLPSLYYIIIERKFKFAYVILPLFTLIIIFSLLLLNSPGALEFFKSYVDQQLLPAMQGRSIENVANSRFSFLKALIVLNIPALLITLFLGYSNHKVPLSNNRTGLLLICLGLCAILPLVISTKQAAYYQLPALPFIFLGIGALLASKTEQVLNFIMTKKYLQKVVLVVFPIALATTTMLALSMLGTNDKRDIKDIYRAKKIALIMNDIGTNTYRFSTVGGTDRKTRPVHYALPGHLNRRFDIQFDSSENSILELVIKINGENFISNKKILFEDEETTLLLLRDK